MSLTLDCKYSGICGGCVWGGQDLALQREQKIATVKALFPEVSFAFSPDIRVRDKVDLVWEEGRLGLYRLGETRQILDIDACPMMTEPLEAFFQQYRSKPPPIRKGSVRLRVSPSGERGVWLDFANADVKTLFDEKDYLRWLSSIAFVEIGQRRKALVWKDGLPKLIDPVLKPWFETYDGEGRPIPLYGPVGGFSQTGFSANRVLVSSVSSAVKQSGIKDWVELFCGNGNFTLSLAAQGYNLEAIEMDPLALEGLQKNLPANVKISRADVYLKSKDLPDFTHRGLLVDPPRAGLREILTLLENSKELPPAMVYVSCFTDVFLLDMERLRKLGFNVTHVEGVDQFPHSPHAEWVALLTRR